MSTIDTLKDCCLAISLSGIVFFSFLSYVSFFDPHRIHIIKHGEEGPEADRKVDEAAGTAFIALFVYSMIAGSLLFIKYGKDNGSSDHIDRWQQQMDVNGKGGVELAESQGRPKQLQNINNQ